MGRGGEDCGEIGKGRALSGTPLKPLTGLSFYSPVTKRAGPGRGAIRQKLATGNNYWFGTILPFEMTRRSSA